MMRRNCGLAAPNCGLRWWSGRIVSVRPDLRTAGLIARRPHCSVARQNILISQVRSSRRGNGTPCTSRASASRKTFSVSGGGAGAPGGFSTWFRRSSLEALEHAARSSLDERLATLRAGSQEGVEHPSSPGTPTDIRLARVSYGDEAVDRVVADVLSRIAQEPTDHPGAEGHYRSKTVLLPSLATIKHGSFRE